MSQKPNGVNGTTPSPSRKPRKPLAVIVKAGWEAMAKNPSATLMALLESDDITPETMGRIHKLLAADILAGKVDPYLGEVASHVLESAIPHVGMRERRTYPVAPPSLAVNVLQQLLTAPTPRRMLTDVDAREIAIDAVEIGGGADGADGAGE